MNKKTLLWLDDYRNPFDKDIDWLVFSPIGRDVQIEWVTSYNQFIDYIYHNGLPDAICFDHDLGDDEKTGYDCAKYVVEYCIDNEITELPKLGFQSSNSVGVENIKCLISSFLKFVEKIEND